MIKPQNTEYNIRFKGVFIMTHTTEFNHEFSNSEKKLSLKERFVKYITSRESAEVFNNALAAMNGGHYVPLDR